MLIHVYIYIYIYIYIVLQAPLRPHRPGRGRLFALPAALPGVRWIYETNEIIMITIIMIRRRSSIAYYYIPQCDIISYDMI